MFSLSKSVFAGGRIAVAAALLGSLALAAPARADDKPASIDMPLSIELNKAVTSGTGCRLTFLAENGTGSALDKTSYEIAVFDAGKQVKKLIVFEFGALPVGKSKVVEFEFSALACDAISRILVNTPQECVANGAPSTLCLERLKTSSLLPIAFGQ